MKRYLVGALVGAIIVFAWQAVAHMVMHHHDAAYKTVPNSEAAIQTLSQIFTADGQYMIPAPDQSASEEEKYKYMESMTGKPWAQVIYHTKFNYNMGMAMGRSFATAFLCVLIFIWLLGSAPGSFFSVFMKGLGIGFFAFMFVWYNQNIWMDVPWEVIKGELIDLLAAWGLCGLWLGWWLNRRPKVTY